MMEPWIEKEVTVPISGGSGAGPQRVADVAGVECVKGPLPVLELVVVRIPNTIPLLSPLMEIARLSPGGFGAGTVP